ncbi:MAG: phosphatase PAP2 family protein [Acidimicrobiia bacterium]|nr:phosphatase PAP2 family protein [Acidimicrobiia bacterium]
MSQRLRSLGHPGVAAAISAAALGTSYAIAVQDPVPQWELDLTEWINSAADWIATALYPVMQFGTLGGPIIVAVGIAVFARDRWLAAATAVSGVVTWFGAKGVKQFVERDRPLSYLPHLDVREGDGTGLGYVSGHSAVAASTAVMVMVVLPRRWRWVPALVAGLVGVARITHGVHLPADVVGGWAFGTLIALGSLWILERVEPVEPTEVVPPNPAS